MKTAILAVLFFSASCAFGQPGKHFKCLNGDCPGGHQLELIEGGKFSLEETGGQGHSKVIGTGAWTKKGDTVYLDFNRGDDQVYIIRKKIQMTYLVNLNEIQDWDFVAKRLDQEYKIGKQVLLDFGFGPDSTKLFPRIGKDVSKAILYRGRARDVFIAGN